MFGNKIKIYYRISDGGYAKIKPPYINNENCLRNFIKEFTSNELTIIADNVSESTMNMIKSYVNESHIIPCNIRNGAGTFTLAYDLALKETNDTIIYFVENDYLHKPNSRKVLFEGFTLPIDYVTLYDHPDKYMLREHGGNKFCEYGSELTRVFATDTTHWKITNSTTMTFAARVNTLKEDELIIRKFTCGIHPENGNITGHPYDFSMFIELYKKEKILISPLPGYSTHGETYWLTKFTNWENISYGS
jgi:hypothetical protein